MTENSPNSMFSWIDGIRFSQSSIFSGTAHVGFTPYPAIIRMPTFTQVMHNWNKSDTSMAFFTIVGSSFLGYKYAINYAYHQASDLHQRRVFGRIFVIGCLFGFLMGARNSYYRLEGLIPNGLAPVDQGLPVKYDYTTETLNQSFWKHIVEPTKRSLK